MSTRSPDLTFTVPSPEENSLRGKAASDLSPMSTITSVSVTLSTVQLTTSPAAIGDKRSMLSKRLRISAASETLDPTADSSLASMTGGVAWGGSLASPLAIRPALTLGPAEAESRFVVAVCVSGTVPGVSEEPSCSSENIFHLVSSRTRRLTSWETLFYRCRKREVNRMKWRVLGQFELDAKSSYTGGTRPEVCLIQSPHESRLEARGWLLHRHRSLSSVCLQRRAAGGKCARVDSTPCG